MAQYKPQFNLKEKGQSLVEVALFLPIFLVIIAGLVEVSNILVTQNSVHNAARVGARFGASGGEDVGIALAALNSVTDVLDLEDTVWDIWAIRGKVAEDGTSFEEWEFNHSYGQKQTEAFSSVVEADIKAEVLKQLQTDENGNTPKKIAAGLDFVGTYLVYDLNSILGLNALESLAGITSVRSLNVMRNQGVDEVTTDACTAFPIALRWDSRSILPPGETGANAWRTDLKYPIPAPNYYSFINHVPNKSLEEAREGYLYYIQDGSSSGQKGWICWNGCACDATALADALTWPGNSNDYTPLSGKCPATGETRVNGFVEMGDPTDKSMHINDWVAASTGSINSNGARTQVESHINLGRALRIIVYQDYDGTGSNTAYKIKRFAIMRLHGYSLDQGKGESFILAEFIQWDDSCGQTTQ